MDLILIGLSHTSIIQRDTLLKHYSHQPTATRLDHHPRSSQLMTTDGVHEMPSLQTNGPEVNGGGSGGGGGKGSANSSPPSLVQEVLHGGLNEMLANERQVAKLMLGKVYCLRCTHCRLITIQWSKFITHAPQCPGLARCATDYQCSVFWCSKCRAMSTERQIITEHIDVAHSASDQAKVIREQLSVSKTRSGGSTCVSPSRPDLTCEAISSPANNLGVPASANTTNNNNGCHQSTSASDFEDERNDVESDYAASEGDDSRLALKRRRPSEAEEEEDEDEEEGEAQQAKLPKLDNVGNLTSNLASALTGTLFANANASAFGMPDTQTLFNALSTMNALGAANGDSGKTLLNLLGTLTKASLAPQAAFPLGLAASPAAGSDRYRLEFDEQRMCSQWSDELTEPLIRKLRGCRDYEITRWQTDARLHCPECPNFTCEELEPMKVHMLTVHMAIPQKYVNLCLRYVGPFSQAVSISSCAQATPENLSTAGGPVKGRRYCLRYSRAALTELCSGLSQPTKEELQTKMDTYTTKAVIVDSKGGLRRFVCEACGYASSNALSDVRKHILSVHCNVDTRWAKICLQASRVDTTTFRLLSDKKLLYHWKYQKEGGFNGSLYGSLMKTSPRSVSSSDWGQSEEAPMRTSHQHALSEDAITLDKADDVTEIVLPFSRAVLRQLISGTGAPDDTVEEMERKMQIYADYKITHYLRNGRSIAFKCPCGRIFYTVKQPDSTMRPATLADCRRHIMSVHAKIPGEFVTLCCQASRISRENDFELLPEESLLKMAIERPMKTTQKPVLTSIPSLTQTNQSPATTVPSNFNNLPNLSDMSLSSFLQASGLQLGNASLSDASLNDSLTASKPLLSTSGKESSAKNTDPEDEFPVLETWSDLENAIHPGLVNVDTHYDPIACLRKAQLPESDLEIEKIIDLPFSEDALRYLVKGYCPDEFFQLLLDKMNIYAAHKVYITRKLGRRYFCCSGCPAKSPHGMGDMRKHILGVHAKISERYKAAAMHCSRLSREDSSLLPYQSLIHLAKMRWKGTNIKSLGELEARLSHNQKLAAQQASNTQRDELGKPACVIADEAEGSFQCSVCRLKRGTADEVKHHIVTAHMLVTGAFKCSVCADSPGFDSERELRAHHGELHSNVELLGNAMQPSELYQLSLQTITVQNHGTVSPQPTTLPPVATNVLNFANLPDLQASLARLNPLASLNIPNLGLLQNALNQCRQSSPSAGAQGQVSSNPSEDGSMRRRKPPKSDLVQIKREEAASLKADDDAGLNSCSNPGTSNNSDSLEETHDEEFRHLEGVAVQETRLKLDEERSRQPSATLETC